MQTYHYDQTLAWFQRANKVIPCGIPGHFNTLPCVPATAYPFFASRARGSRFWDVDGNEFIDYMCGYGPIVLGCAHPAVDEAYQAQMREADTVSIASPRSVELAELLVDEIPRADWAYFAKNGADMVNFTIMIARAATGRKKFVAIGGGYHGTTPWMQAMGHHGVIEDDHQHFIRIPWNDVAALERVIAQYPDQIAGFISSPYHHPIFVDNELPAEGYWNRVQQLLNKHGIVFISDDVRCGFRLHPGGSHEYFGYQPDLICFCKAIGNGYPISAMVGVDALRPYVERILHTGSYWYSAGPMAAAIATIKELKRIDGYAMMRSTGQKLCDGLVAVAQNHGYTLKVSGHPGMPYLRLVDDDSLMLHQRWCGECTRRGAYFSSHHNWFVTTAHTDEDLQRTFDIADDSFKALAAHGD